MLIEKVAQMTLLFDFYGQFLTDKQQQFFQLYYEDDLSLGEIAEQYQISRQAVHDLLKRSEKMLHDYESKLGLVEKYLYQRNEIIRIHQLVKECRQEQNLELLETVEKHLDNLLR